MERRSSPHSSPQSPPLRWSLLVRTTGGAFISFKKSIVMLIVLLAKVLRSISVVRALRRTDGRYRELLFFNADPIHSSLSRYSSRSPKHQPIDRAHTHLSTRPAKPPALSPTFRISISTLSDLSFPCASPPHSQAAHIQPNPPKAGPRPLVLPFAQPRRRRTWFTSTSTSYSFSSSTT